MTTTADLAAFVCSAEALPAETVARSKLAIRDYLAVALYGSTQETGETLRRYADAAPAHGPATVLDGTTASHERAALLNGAFGHAADYDDTFASFPLHPTTVVVPAALSAGEVVNADGEQLLRAYALGVETLYRVGHSVFPRQYDRGFHSTAAVGPLGAASAAGVLLGFDRDTLRRAFGIAASTAGGLRRNFGTTTKPLHAGLAASGGLRAALLAREGATADPHILDGSASYGEAMAGNDYDPSTLAGDDFAGVSDIALKLFPSAHISHGVIEALRRLRAEGSISPDDIASVTATLHPGGEDVLIHENPSNALEAKFSVEFCLAATLRSGDLGLATFTDEHIIDESRQATLAAVNVAYDADAVADLGRYGGRITVETVDGTVYEREAVDAPGSPRNPVDDDRLRRKFDSCLARTPIDGDRLAATVDALEDETVAELIAAARPD